MILVGEVEFNENHYHPCGGPSSYLFVGTQLGANVSTVEYVYALSPVPTHYHVGDIFKSRENLSVTQFLQRFVDEDEQIGRGVIKSLANCKVRLKGMTEWIERKSPLAENIPVENYKMVWEGEGGMTH